MQILREKCKEKTGCKTGNTGHKTRWMEKYVYINIERGESMKNKRKRKGDSLAGWISSDNGLRKKKWNINKERKT